MKDFKLEFPSGHGEGLLTCTNTKCSSDNLKIDDIFHRGSKLEIAKLQKGMLTTEDSNPEAFNPYVRIEFICSNCKQTTTIEIMQVSGSCYMTLFA